MLVTTAACETPGSAHARSHVSCSRLLPPAIFMNGFGIASRDTGHSRVPDPPERIIGSSCIRTL